MAVSLLFSTAPVLATILIEVDKSSQNMVVSVDGEVRYTWPVSTGRGGYATPAGSFRAFRLEEDHYSKEWDEAPMPHAIFFTDKGHAIHGSFETRRLGLPASHGCVRLAPRNAATLFALVKARGVTNAKVVITGSETVIARRSAPAAQADARTAPLPAPPTYAPPGAYYQPQPQTSAPQYYYRGYSGWN